MVWQRCQRIRKVFRLQLCQDVPAIPGRAGVEPRDGFNRRLIERVVIRYVRTRNVSLQELAIALGVNLLDTTEATELTFNAVEVPMMITVGGREFCVAPFVGYRHSLDTVHRKRQLRDPRSSRTLIRQIELCGWRLINRRPSTEIVDR